jgi:hypothetical protein
MQKLLAFLCRFSPHKWKRGKTSKICKRCGLVRDIKPRGKA